MSEDNNKEATEEKKAPEEALNDASDASSEDLNLEMKWYVIHTQTGSEEKARAGLESRMKSTELKKYIGEVVVPTEQVSEVRSGKKRITERKFFPGYIIIKMAMNKESWYLVKSTPGITGFIGPGRKPTPITLAEVDSILQRTEETETKPMPKIMYEIGESIQIVQGPFSNFNGQVMEIFPDRGKLKVSVSIFGRSTLVELEYWQVEKI
ncbi:MAG: transcriptional antiterminator NusG [Candidatus Omnitrophota bacterium]|jgi:transcriptional antiterminator NusG